MLTLNCAKDMGQILLYVKKTEELQMRKRDCAYDTDVAVRSSATAEDLPDASFAGQQETYLNVHGVKDVLESCHKCFASIFTDRAISYRTMNKFDHFEVALSVGVQKNGALGFSILWGNVQYRHRNRL